MFKCTDCGKIYFHPHFKQCEKCWKILTRNAGPYSCYVRNTRWWVYSIVEFFKSQWMFVFPMVGLGIYLFCLYYYQYILMRGTK